MLTKLTNSVDQISEEIMYRHILKGGKFILIKKKRLLDSHNIPFNCILRRRHIIDGGKTEGNYCSRGYLTYKNISNFSNSLLDSWIFVKIVKNMPQIDTNVMIEPHSFDMYIIDNSKKTLSRCFKNNYDIIIEIEDEVYQNMYGNLYSFK